MLTLYRIIEVDKDVSFKELQYLTGKGWEVLTTDKGFPCISRTGVLVNEFKVLDKVFGYEKSEREYFGKTVDVTITYYTDLNGVEGRK